MERKQELLLVSCKVQEGEQETHTQHQVEEFPWLRESLRTDPYRAQAGKTVLNCYQVLAGHSVIPHSTDDNYRGPQSRRSRDAHFA